MSSCKKATRPFEFQLPAAQKDKTKNTPLSVKHGRVKSVQGLL